MIGHKMKKITIVMYILVLLLLTGCSREEFSKEETGTTDEEIPVQELTEEEGEQQGAEPEQIISQDISGDKVTQSVPEESGDGTGQDGSQQAIPDGEEKDVKSARLQKYQSVLTDITTKQIYPDGTDCGFDGSSTASGNQFAVYDVDKDGEEELILRITSTSTAGMREVVYDYDEETDTVREEYSGFPGAYFYDNGLIEEEWSHNQGMAPLGDFWPYTLHRYQAESDSYQCIFMVDAWEKEFREQDYDGNPYPEEIDAEKSGTVYYLMEGGAYDMTATVPVSKTVYEEWRKEQGLGSARIEIPFQELTKDISVY
ncbi:MAG: hypothetical protein K2L82_15055 [Lachnospiraceae bacterium]|nr:hypothetical protein [Lachnospiraceae bacterium]